MRHRRLLVLAASLVGCAAPLAAVAEGCSTTSQTSAPDTSSAALTQLEQDTGVHWVTFHDYAYGAASFLKPTTPPAATLTGDATPAAVATTFFAKYGGIFQVVDPAHELTLESSGGSGGFHYAAFTQTEGAASVYGTRLTLVFDKAGRVLFVSGLFVPGLQGAPTTPKLTPLEAMAKAQASMATIYPKDVLVRLEPTPAPVLTLYTVGGPAVLAYTMLVSYATDGAVDTIARPRVVMDYVVDAATGAIVEAYDAIESQHDNVNGAVVPVEASGMGSISGAPAKTFPAMATLEDDASVPPFYLQNAVFPPQDSYLGVQAPRFASTRASPLVVSSTNEHSWDHGDVGVPSAVDAYTYVGLADAWWQAHGRNSYDNKGGTIGISADDASAFANALCPDNAFWDREGVIHVCPNDDLPYPLSVDLNMMAHEYQHAVTQYTLRLGFTSQSNALNESFSDVFGQLIAHATPSEHEAEFLMGPKVRPPTGLRNLECPHRSVGKPLGVHPQPDNVNDPLYVGGSHEAHVDDGIPNKAWYLASFGGKDFTPPYVSVVASPKLAPLGWEGSEALYVSLLLDLAVPPAANFANVGRALTTMAANTDIDGDETPAATAVGCAWYAVGVLSKPDLDELGVDSCACTPPDAGSRCDAGMDAGAKDAAPDAGGFSCTTLYNACGIVTSGDVAYALGDDLGAGAGPSVPGFWQCGYPGADVDQPDASPTFVFDMTCTPAPLWALPRIPVANADQTVGAVSGLGDEAWWTLTTMMTADGTFSELELYVSYENLLLTFDLEDVTDAYAARSQAITLAHDALAHLSGDAGAPPPADAGKSDGGDAGVDADPNGC